MFSFDHIKKYLTVVLIAVLAILACACAGAGDSEKEDKEKTEEPRYLKGSVLAIAESYVGKDVTGLIKEIGTLEGEPKVAPANDGGGYEGTYTFDGFTAKTYAKSANSDSLVTDIIPDKSSNVYKRSISGTGGEQPKKAVKIKKSGEYDSKEEVSKYIHKYHKLPKNYITKKDARVLGWKGGSLQDYAPDKCIGGDVFKNRERKLPDDKDIKYYECDIDTMGAENRGAKRLVYTKKGAVYYTEDHYNTFVKLFDEG